MAADGAAAKGTVLLKNSGLDSSVIEYVVDRDRHKHGKFMQGVHLEILSPDRLLRDMAD